VSLVLTVLLLELFSVALGLDEEELELLAVVFSAVYSLSFFFYKIKPPRGS
jgi:hypothetical protein